MQLSKETYKIQSDLATYCRTNKQPNLPGISENRIDQYRRLVYNIIDDTLEGAFPITKSFLKEKEWDKMIFDFCANHSCQTPSVWKLPFEFYEYLVKNEIVLKIKYPFLTDLIYFEWLEIDIHTMPDVVQQDFQQKGNWFTNKIILNKEFKIVQLNHPVHQQTPKQLIKNNQNGIYYVLIYREADTGTVQFFDLSPLHAFLIMKLNETDEMLHLIITELCIIFKLQRSSEIDSYLISFLETLKEKKFVLGFSKN